MKNTDLLKELQIIMHQTKTIANINPGSIEETIYKKCYNAYRIIDDGGSIEKIDVMGLGRPYADKYGYDASLLEHIDKMEKLIKIEREKNEY